jgi:hypothetical protein
MTITPGPNLPGPEGWRAQNEGGHAVAPERAANERLIAEAGIGRSSVPVWVWALAAAIVVALAVLFFS